MWVANAEQQIGAITEVLLRGDGPRTAEERDRALQRIAEIITPARIVLGAGYSPEDLAEVMRRHAEEPVMIIPPEPPALSPRQLRAAAERLRERYSPPSVAMSPGEYLVHEGLRAFADALVDVAGSGQTEAGS